MDLATISDEEFDTVVLTTYTELKPFIEELVRVLEKVYELGKSRGEPLLSLEDYLIMQGRTALGQGEEPTALGQDATALGQDGDAVSQAFGQGGMPFPQPSFEKTSLMHLRKLKVV